MTCNKDCFNCQYEDCVYDELEADDYRALQEIEEYITPKTLKQKAIAARKREYYAANKEAIAARKREYYAANKEAIAARKREYRKRRKESAATSLSTGVH